MKNDAALKCVAFLPCARHISKIVLSLEHHRVVNRHFHLYPRLTPELSPT